MVRRWFSVTIYKDFTWNQISESLNCLRNNWFRPNIYPFINPILPSKLPLFSNFYKNLKWLNLAQRKFRQIEYCKLICIWFDGKFRQIEFRKLICIGFDGKIRESEYYNLGKETLTGRFLRKNIFSAFSVNLDEIFAFFARFHVNFGILLFVHLGRIFGIRSYTKNDTKVTISYILTYVSIFATKKYIFNFCPFL